MSDQRLHVLMLCSWLPNRVQPTNGNFVEKHIRLLLPKVRVGVLQVEYDPAMKAGQVAEEVTHQDGYHLHTIYFGSNASRLLRLRERLYWFRIHFKAYIKKWGQPQLLHVHVAMPAVLVARWVYLRYNIPFLLSCHSSGFLPISSRQYPWWQRQLLVWAANKASGICPVSNALAAAWRQNGLRSPVRVIPNVVNTELFSPPAIRPQTPPLRLLHISNFAPAAKNVTGILRVAKRLKQAKFPFSLTIAGDGDLSALSATARQLGLNNQHLQLIGTLSELQVAAHMRSHHCFILFSNYETQGITAMEAVCCELPIIATRVGGLPEIIDTAEKGILIEAGDEDALYDAIRTFRAPDKRIQANHPLPYSANNVRAQLLSLYYSVLSLDH